MDQETVFKAGEIARRTARELKELPDDEVRYAVLRLIKEEVCLECGSLLGSSCRCWSND